MMTADRNILTHKLYGVIYEYASEKRISLRAALGVFYQSNLYTEIRNGISDMHCRSDGYLAEELEREMNAPQKSATFNIPSTSREP